jgi:hypothetical protein
MKPSLSKFVCVDGVLNAIGEEMAATSIRDEWAANERGWDAVAAYALARQAEAAQQLARLTSK